VDQPIPGKYIATIYLKYIPEITKYKPENIYLKYLPEITKYKPENMPKIYA